MGYGPAIVPLSGLASLTGYVGGEPEEVGISYGDPSGGITAAAGVLAALVARRQTGRGQHIDLSLWEGTAASSAKLDGYVDARKGAGAMGTRSADVPARLLPAAATIPG